MIHATVEEIEGAALGQPIEAARLTYTGACDGLHGWDTDQYGDPPEWGPVTTWAEACAEIEQHGTIGWPDYDDDAPRVIAWTADRVIWHHEYDCSWSVAWLPRNPKLSA